MDTQRDTMRVLLMGVARMWSKKTYGEDLLPPLTEEVFYAGIGYDGLSGLNLNLNLSPSFAREPEHLSFAKRTYR